MRTILWLNPPDHPLGENITKALGRYVEKLGWELIDDPRIRHDLIFFGSDSTLTPELVEINKPKVLWFWGWLPQRFLDRGFSRFYHQKLRLVKKCTIVLVPSIGTQEQLYNFGIKSNLVFPGIDNTYIDNVPKRDENWLSDSEQTVIYIGRLVPHKGVSTIIQALHILNQKSKDFFPNTPTLNILGQGERKEKLMKLAKDMQVKTNFIEADDYQKIRMLKRSTIFVSGSFYEGFGAPAAEAAYCGIPIILRDSPHNRFFWQDTAMYFWSEEGLANEIAQLITDESLRNEFAKKARKRVDDVFTMSRWSLFMHEVFTDCIEQEIKEELGKRMRNNPSREEYGKIYDEEHERNIEFHLYRIDPTWKRHWRVKDVLGTIKKRALDVPSTEPNIKDHYKEFKVLDIGCGEGVYTAWFTGEGFKTWAVDCSPIAIMKAREIVKQYGNYDLAEFKVAFADSLIGLGFGNRFFDFIWCGELLEHLPDDMLHVSMLEMLSALKSGGLFIASTPIGEHHNDTLHLRNWSDKSITNFFDKFVDGLKNIKIKKIAEEGSVPSCYFIVGEKI